MLPKQNRLVKNKDIKQTLSTGVRFFYGDLQIRLSKSALKIPVTKFRMLVSVSKKIHKKSVYRHKISRSILAIIRQAYNTNSLPQGFDCFISITNKNILNSQIHLDYELLPNLIYQKSQNFNLKSNQYAKN